MGPNIAGSNSSADCRGGHPVLRAGQDSDSVGDCRNPVGGTKTIGAPEYVLTVTNPPDEPEAME